MTRKQPSNQVTADVTVGENGEWVATSVGGPKVRTTGLTKRQAISNLESKLAETFERPVTVIEKVRLPRVLADEVTAYLADLDQELALQKKREARVVGLAKRLVIDGKLSQKEVAALLRLSGTWLGQLLKKDGVGDGNTGEHKRG